MKMLWLKKAFLSIVIFTAIGSSMAQAQGCSDKLFSVTINNNLTIGEAIENLAERCGLTVVVKDSGAQHRLEKKLYFVKLNNATLKTFLDTILKDNDLNYTLKGNKLILSYLVTRTFKVHYIAGERSGKSSASVTVAGNSGSSKGGDSGKGSSITIEMKDDFQFWSRVKDEIHRILASAGDGSTHYTKMGDAWIGPDGQKWEYNPTEPIVNPEAGMITVTGTARQIERVQKYIATLMRQIKTQVMIDVRILSVKLDKGKTTGIDWSQLYGLQNISINAGAYTQSDTSGISVGDVSGIAGVKVGAYAKAQMVASVKDIIKFLSTQGDVTSISSPRIMTMSNQPAMISVGTEIFYKLKTTNKVGGSDTATSESDSVQSVFAGILLDITPEVDERGMVTLKINPSVSKTVEELAPDKERQMPPDLVRRQLASVIKVRDGNHAILGGLITRGKGIKNQKVPLLGDIPLLGYAFKHEEIIDTTEELVIIITPHIIKSGKNITLKDLGYTELK